jgi:hypothetical protein
MTVIYHYSKELVNREHGMRAGEKRAEDRTLPYEMKASRCLIHCGMPFAVNDSFLHSRC